MEYKRLTDDELADFLQRACVQLVPELTQQLLSLGAELAEYRAKIEQGTLIELPCKVGDTVWEANKNYIAPWDFVVDKIEILENNYIRILDKYENNYDMEELGKTLFLTREEAKAKLKEV